MRMNTSTIQNEAPFPSAGKEQPEISQISNDHIRGGSPA